MKAKFNEKFINGIEKIITAVVFTFVLILKNFNSNIDWFDILEIGAAVFIIDFLFVISKKKILEEIMSEGSTAKIGGLLLATIFSFGITCIRNAGIMSVSEKYDAAQFISLIFANMLFWPFLSVAVIFASHSIAFVVYLFFGKKLIEKFGEKHVSI